MLTYGLNSASVLAQVNIGTNPASILGIFLAVAGAGLYFLRTVRPELSRDQDIFFAAVGLLCGFIFIFQGWRLDPILQFGQLLLVGTTVYFAYESIRLRGIATQQAKRSTPIVDRERDVSDRYDYDDRGRYGAEVEDYDRDPLPYDPYYEEERPPRPQIRGSRDSRASRSEYYDDPAPRRPERRNDIERIEDDRPPRRRISSSKRTNSRSTSRLEKSDWDSSSPPIDSWDNSPTEERRAPRRSNERPTRPRSEEDIIQPRTSRKRRPRRDSDPRRERGGMDEVIPTDYEDYNPIVRLEDEKDEPPEVKLDDE
ncbi:Ycf66 protein N-terminus [Rivularia sp. PCC 7116]|uniref:Ycf66 family protein n=1 Tax=Rivularia sp. PCC 7116 TaxID=373994 RepID=UPI00029EF2A0|nr:Ycf66 family protein [Rivularia sp. PCC 7116]AFY53249.1 Ycf66 protein N-terminus [Rivularia sp. PCC 7116]